MGYYNTPCSKAHWLYPPRGSFDAAQGAIGRPIGWSDNDITEFHFLPWYGFSRNFVARIIEIIQPWFIKQNWLSHVRMDNCDHCVRVEESWSSSVFFVF